ncbi:MAG: hypothetical protein RCG15_03095 [Candidatus Rickettsia vulgarisii]
MLGLLPESKNIKAIRHHEPLKSGSVELRNISFIRLPRHINVGALLYGDKK